MRRLARHFGDPACPGSPIFCTRLLAYSPSRAFPDFAYAAENLRWITGRYSGGGITNFVATRYGALLAMVYGPFAARDRLDGDTTPFLWRDRADRLSGVVRSGIAASRASGGGVGNSFSRQPGINELFNACKKVLEGCDPENLQEGSLSTFKGAFRGRAPLNALSDPPPPAHEQPAIQGTIQRQHPGAQQILHLAGQPGRVDHGPQIVIDEPTRITGFPSQLPPHPYNRLPQPVAAGRSPKASTDTRRR